MFLSLSPPPPHWHCHFLSSIPKTKIPHQPSSLPFPSQFPSKSTFFNANLTPPAAALPVASSSSSSTTSSNSISLQKVSRSAIKRISDKLRQLGYLEADRKIDADPVSGSAGEIFIPTPHDVPNDRIGSTLDSSWTSPDNPVPQPGSGPIITGFSELWKKKKKEEKEETKERKEAVPSMAELTIRAEELRRLRGLGIKLTQKVRVGKAGITEGVVNSVHERWRRSEVVKIKCDDLCRLNMKRTHEILERKTGGLVVWRSGSIIILYRGSDYKYPYFDRTDQVSTDSNASNVSNSTQTRPALVPGVGSQNTVRLQLSGEAKLAEEADGLLSGLGPRFLDWAGLDPKPIDADLLPGVVMGFRKPFRILPFGIKQRLTDSEMTTLRRLSRPLPCHFALGRNRNLQGLAEAMIKLWERCEIAKIAVKFGVQNTNSEIMAEELKKLTGGTLLSRDREYIVFYRGKDFLPLAVSTAIKERRRKSNITAKIQEESHEDSESLNKETIFCIENREKREHSAINKVEAKLSLAIRKKEKAEKLLEELENASELPREENDKEAISEEERYMLRKVGLRMKPFLLLGRRGVFDGTVENMHLHWKYRELVKIISKEKEIEEVERGARILESESGGILVAVERVSKGYAIIFYRGKNYRRPKTLRPKSLLNKREAMKRSLEAQRRQSLKLHVLSLSRKIEELQELMNKDESLPPHSIQESTDYIEEASRDSSEDAPETAYEVPSIGTSEEEVSIANSKLGIDIQRGAEVCSTSGTGSHEEENLDEAGTVEIIPFKANPLSNKERLILRKQALKMRKRPVLAVGRNNVITGVAKTIKTHFQKHPLAIVNIKGRAEGTSVQQLVFELEEATGAVLVSREPNKVILYRGWTKGEKPGDTKKKDNANESTRGENGDSITPDLMEAIRVECGFHPSKEEV